MEIVDFSDQMDYVKAVKSPYEIELWKKCVKLHDELMSCVQTVVKPGLTEKQVSNKFRAIADEMDCAELNLLLGTDPVRPRISSYPYQNAIIGKNDYFMLLIEVAAAGGVWGELGRNIKLGDPPSDAYLKATEDQIEVMDKTAAMMKPGVKVSDVSVALNKMLTDKGYDAELRICSHGQGYDIVDRPVFVKEETMVLKENMFIAHHPNTARGGVVGYNCDNYLITKDGAKLLSKTPRGIIHINHEPY